MKKLIIDRQIWLRGEGSEESYLLRSHDKKKCCIGIYLEQTGTDQKLLAGRKSVRSYFKLPALLPTTPETDWLTNDDIVTVLYGINDNRIITDAEREAKLTTLFAAQGVEVEFIN